MKTLSRVRIYEPPLVRKSTISKFWLVYSSSEDLLVLYSDICENLISMAWRFSLTLNHLAVREKFCKAVATKLLWGCEQIHEVQRQQYHTGHILWHITMTQFLLHSRYSDIYGNLVFIASYKRFSLRFEPACSETDYSLKHGLDDLNLYLISSKLAWNWGRLLVPQRYLVLPRFDVLNLSLVSSKSCLRLDGWRGHWKVNYALYFITVLQLSQGLAPIAVYGY